MEDEEKQTIKTEAEKGESYQRCFRATHSNLKHMLFEDMCVHAHFFPLFCFLQSREKKKRGRKKG